MSTKPETMDAETLEALRGSIRKWEGIVAGTKRDMGADNCPLCKAFQDRDDRGECYGCPVMEATGRAFCIASPYMDFHEARERRDYKLAKKHAQAELDFLKSLLPEGAA